MNINRVIRACNFFKKNHPDQEILKIDILEDGSIVFYYMDIDHYMKSIKIKCDAR